MIIIAALSQPIYTTPPVLLGVALSWHIQLVPQQLADRNPPLVLSHLPIEMVWLTRMRHRHYLEPTAHVHFSRVILNVGILCPPSSTRMPACLLSLPLNSSSRRCACS